MRAVALFTWWISNTLRLFFLTFEFAVLFLELPLPQTSLCIQAPLRSQLKCHLFKEAFSQFPVRVALLITFTLLSFFIYLVAFIAIPDRSFIVCLYIV